MIQEAGGELIRMAMAGAVGGVLTLVGAGIAIGSKLGKLASISEDVLEIKTELLEVRKFQREMIGRMTRVETLLKTIVNGGP